MKDEEGVVARRTKGYYFVRSSEGKETECRIKGLLFKDSRFNNQIAVGDKVRFILSQPDKMGLIKTVEKRRSFLSRNRVGINAEQVIAANIDYLLIVASAIKPPFRENLIFRFLVAAIVGNITPVLVITKTDLVKKSVIEQLIEPFLGLELTIIQFSSKVSNNNPQLEKILTTGVSVLAGQSGVGKSSLLNKLFPTLSIKVGKISAKTQKGSHTTSYAIMHHLAGKSYVIDTPGIREFGLWNISQINLNQFFPLIKEYHYQCKHRDCAHIHEPDCAVKKDVENHIIHKRIYQGYCSIFRSLPSS